MDSTRGARLGTRVTGRSGLAGHAPEWLDECAERWSLRVGPPFPYAFASLALPADLPDGTPAVLKLQYPDHGQPARGRRVGALGRRGGDPAARPRPGAAGAAGRAVPARHAAARAARRRGAGRGGRPAAPALAAGRRAVHPARRGGRRLGGPDARAWERAGRPYERRLLDAALDLLAGLVDSQGEQVLVNQDLHAGNVLRADPGAVAGDRPEAADRASGSSRWCRSCAARSWGTPPTAVRHRLDRLSAELGLDRERVRGWTIGAHAGLEHRTATRSSPTRSRWPAGCSTAP